MQPDPELTTAAARWRYDRTRRPIRCGATNRSDFTDMRIVVCVLTPGHEGMHDNRRGSRWADEAPGASPGLDELRRASVEQAFEPCRRRLSEIEAEIGSTWRGRLALKLARWWARRRK